MNDATPVAVPARAEPTLPADAADLRPLALLDRALARGATPEQLTALMDLQERYEKREAKKAFDRAMAAAKPKFSQVLKNRHVGFESKSKDPEKRTDYDHEDFQAVADAVDGPLSAEGLSYRFRTASPVNEPITVTCILSHRDGHSEETALAGPRDATGNKNPLQQIGSTITYLQRYTLKAALGVGARRVDTDALDVGDDEPATVSPEDIAQLQSLIVETGSDLPRFLKHFEVAKLDQLSPAQFPKALHMLREKARAGKVAVA